ncbi:Uncharacterized protein FKW44_010638, partial [Caligus rogercresseyi]
KNSPLHSGINDASKFTVQFQILGQYIKFFRPCNNCGRLYNDIFHAFVDCPVLKL